MTIMDAILRDKAAIEAATYGDGVITHTPVLSSGEQAIAKNVQSEFDRLWAEINKIRYGGESA